MKSSASVVAMLAIAAGTLLAAASGCELIAGVDRNKIGNTGGDGGGGSTPTGGGGTGGTTTTAECVDPARDCPAPSGECKVAACDANGQCIENDVEDGTLAVSQTEGDCKKNVCQGGAVVMDQPDDDDPFDDGNDCTDNSCNDGTPQSAPARVGFGCDDDGGKVCDGDGACVECITNTDCTDPAEPTCIDNACVPATCDDEELNGNETAVDCGGSCKGCDVGQACNVGGDCFHKICGGDGTCAAPTCSDGEQNGGDYLGDNGETDVDCGGPCGASCGPNQGCDANADCVGDECSGVGGTCVPNCSDQVKNNLETDEDCGGGTCGPCAVGQDCGNQDANCVSAAYCDAGVCAAKKANGLTCAGNNQCVSGQCVDGVCCNNACAGTCAACDVAGNTGTCTLIPTGTDPDNECNGNGGADVCDGGGACAGPNGAACTAPGDCASGNCADGVCCGSPCGGLCEACDLAGTVGTCTLVPNDQDPDNECAGSLSCNGAGVCQPKLANGTTCTLNAECTSGQCVDGVCCNTACTGSCQACTAELKGTGTDGTCGFIAAGTDPGNECVDPATCDGAGACKKAPGGSCVGPGDCASNFCVDGVCCVTVCNGTCEACDLPGTSGTCTFIPAGTDPDGECTAPQVCNASHVCADP